MLIIIIVHVYTMYIHPIFPEILMSTSIEEFLCEQSQQYNHHLTIRNETQRILRFQHNIRTSRTIPKQYLPPKSLQLTLPNTILTSDYQQKYLNLFLQHLNDVITSNTITMELQDAQIKHILFHTEKKLATLPTNSATITQYYHHFITDNNIESHDIHPDLLRHLPYSSTTPSTINPSHPTPPTKALPQNPPPATRKSRKRPNLRRKNQNKRRRQNPPPSSPSPSPQPSDQPPTTLHFLGKRRDTSTPTT